MQATDTRAITQQHKSDAILKGPQRQDKEVAATGTITCTTNRDSLASADIILSLASRRPWAIDALKSISGVCREDALIAVNARYSDFHSMIADATPPRMSQAHVRTNSGLVYACVFVLVCVYERVLVSMRVSICIYMCVCVCICICMWLYVCVHMYMLLCMFFFFLSFFLCLCLVRLSFHVTAYVRPKLCN